MTLLDEVRALYERVKDLTREARTAIIKEVPEALQEAFYAFQKDQYFDPKNAGESKEFLSPSGRYKLVVTNYATSPKTTTGPRSWDYTEGKVFRKDSDTPIGSIRRNYSRFPYLFVENHPDGHDYLIGGENYQGQTILQLTTGEKRGLLPEEAKQGHGFCWAQYTFNEKAQILVVDGCFWACPYEYRFFDFSNPMQGWPQLEYEGLGEEPENWVDADRKAPTFEEDGTIITYQTKYGEPGEEDAWDDEDDDGNKRPQRVVATRTWKREGRVLKEIACWVSEDEQKYRADQEEGRKRWEAWMTEFQTTDPLYLKVQELSKQAPFERPKSCGTGVTYEGWCPDFKVQETRICQEILRSKEYLFEIEWGAKTGPVKISLRNHKTEKKDTRFFMEHSVASVEAAFAHAREFMGGAS